MNDPSIPTLADALLSWFDRTRRDLPWRQNRTPYRVWLAEIMLQQTQVQTAIPYYERFLSRFPTLADLAQADEQAVLKLWEGLGYYSRARNLLAAARQVMREDNGQLPCDFKALRALPGIGDYTAGAILSLACGQQAAAVDGNVVRVLARWSGTAWSAKSLQDRRQAADFVLTHMPAGRPGDFNEALMDLGATVCLPREPRCPACPLAGGCQAYCRNLTAALPLRDKSPDVPTERRLLLLIAAPGFWHVRQRPPRGLLAGLFTFDWLAPDQDPRAFRTWLQGQDNVLVQPLPSLTHRFSHLAWHVDALRLGLPRADLGELAAWLETDGPQPDGRWAGRQELQQLPFPAAVDQYRRQELDEPPKTASP
ncbi:MAG: A/G-specific adenine glycosylase [Clostridiaceae bacterium]|jgi:A/G-specific adenine glycosylase|nr:A/G-specific adenine glycosylase [Clostridiaceae bacterium]